MEGCFYGILNGSQWRLKKVQWVFEGSFKGVSRIFPESFKGVSRKIAVRFNGVLSGVQASLKISSKSVLGKFQGYFKDVSKKF